MKVAIVGLLTVVAFAIGLFGIAMLLPEGEAPELGETETAEAREAGGPTAAEALNDLVGTQADSLIALGLPTATTDSLRLLREQLAQAQAQIPELLARLDALEQAAEAQVDRRARAQALSATLSRLEEAELRALLSRLDADVLADLYAEASARNRTKLLQALPASRGAALVERIAAGDRRAIPLERAAVPPPPTTPAPAAAPNPAPAEASSEEAAVPATSLSQPIAVQ